MDNVPHLALPLQVIGPSYATVQQDTVDELATTVGVVCAFPLGSRLERPEFGVQAPALQDEPLDLADVERAVTTWEPRASISVTERPGPDALSSVIQVSVGMARSHDEELD
jgi:phage baseplate assembly protein W